MRDLADCRSAIDAIDTQISKLFMERMDVARDVARYKQAQGMPVLDRSREEVIIEKARSRVPAELASYAESIQQTLMAASRAVQMQMLSDASPCKESVSDSEDLT